MSEVSPLAKTIAFASIGVVIALSALIASLPLNLPSKQKYEGDTSTPVDSGDTAWLLVATIFGLFLSPALAFLYGTVYGNTSNLLRNVAVTSSLITFLWILFSFSLSYGKDSHRNGIIGLPLSYYMFRHTVLDTAEYNDASTIPNSIFAVFELGFALVTPTIILSSLNGRINLHGFLAFIFVWHLIVYTPVAHIVWSPKGAYHSNRIRDFAGGLVVHQLAAITSLALHLVLGKDTIPKAAPVADPEKALYYAFVVWFLWFGFNSGKAHEANGVAAQSIVNTIAAGFASILTSFFYNLIFEKATTPVSIAYAILVGLIAITPASGYVTVGGALVISISTYFIVAIISHFITGEGVSENEPFSVLTIHAVAGVVGFLWTAIISYHFVNPDGVDGLTSGEGVPLGYQISGALALWGCGFIATFFIAFVINLIVPLAENPVEYIYKPNVETAESTNKQEDAAREKEYQLENTAV